MKLSESWLREWVNPKLTREALCDTLTMAGLEVEELMPVADAFAGIVVGQILQVNKHPEADRLTVCTVEAGETKPLQIVCGATNVKAGLKVPVAKIGAVLPNKTVIKPTSIRHVASEGMMCSATELGLSEESQGLLELPTEAPIGEDLRVYLKLEDYVIDISVTPNRGDCLSVKGMAREISALTKTPLHEIPIMDIQPTLKDQLPLVIEAKAGCPHYAGRVIRNVRADITTPTWLKERLRRSGIRSINPIVDVTNYVMLELGQPMHAFDLNTIQQAITIRYAQQGEKILLLDGTEKELDAETLIIADQENPLAIAGVMGGISSSVTLLTTDIFLESAYFSPQTIARQRQYYGVTSDSAYRYERGVDPTIQRQAIERATSLILEIVGGKPGPIIEETSSEYLPKQNRITLSAEKIIQVLGIAIPEKEVEDILTALQFSWRHDQTNWMIETPLYRFDMTLPEDIVEEIARLYGYDKIPTKYLKAELRPNQIPDTQRDLHVLRQALCDQGYYEIISYSFIDKQLQALLDPEEKPRELLNPITADMTVMRTNLWPGLIRTLLHNQSRQQHRVRLFEIGTCFTTQDNQLLQQSRIAGLITGSLYAEQWSMALKPVDFYDLKANVENILKLFFPMSEILFEPASHPALHPGQTANIYHKDQKIGIIGCLHPKIMQSLALTASLFLFELDLDSLQKSALKRFHEISKFPEIRRDLALLVNQAIPSKDIQDTIKRVVGDWLKDSFIFDIYQGKGISPGSKSIALALILQHPTRTLVDDEVAELLGRVIKELKEQLGAELRS